MKRAYFVFGAVCLWGQSAGAPAGVFEGSGDVGTVLHAGSVAFDAAAHTYTITASGENLWGTADAFQFVWKKASGDVALTADIAFPDHAGDPHKKAVLMIRQSLDAGSAYADVALHASGLTSLQARDADNVATHEVQSNLTAPARLRIEKRGNRFYMSLGTKGEELHFAGGSLRVPMREPFYIGLGVSAHNKDAVEKATFSNVTIAPVPAGQPALYSTLETVTVSSTDRRVTYVSRGLLEAPMWNPDGASLTFHEGGKLERIPVEGGQPQQEITGNGATEESKSLYMESDRSGGSQIWRTAAEGSSPEQITSDEFSNCFPHLSPDGKRLAFLSYEHGVTGHPLNQEVSIRVLSLESGKITVVAKLIGGRGSLDAPSWSPDSKRLAFVSYQMIP